MNELTNKLDKNNPLPLYKQLENILYRQIEYGEKKSNECIPCERDLAQIYGISRMTARRAVMELVGKDLLYRISGKGTYVCDINKKKETKILGVILKFVDSAVTSILIHGIEDSAYENGYGILSSNDDGNYERQMIQVRKLINKGVEGIIFAPIPSDTQYEKNKDIITELEHYGIPVVLIDRYLEGVEIDYIGSDNIEGAYNLTTHLLKIGHKQIGFIRSQYSTAVKERLEGYKKALSQFNLNCDPSLIKGGEFIGKEAGYIYMKEFLQMKKKRPTAVFAMQEIMAKGIFDAVEEANLRIPEDIAVVAYDNYSEVADILQLTTIDHPLYERGRIGCQRLIDRIKNKNGPVQKIILKSKLIIRNSCGFNLKVRGPFENPNRP